MDLTTREFFVDGIKRDRWTWSGDAIQSYLMNYYLRFDTDCVRRTIRQLRGKDPVTAHVNTIMDYTFYWFKSVLDFYQYTGDIRFVREIYPRMQTLMQYVIGRLNPEGMAEGKEDDWIFVDWVDFPMHKRGTLCFEQILLCKAFQTMHTWMGSMSEFSITECIIRRLSSSSTISYIMANIFGNAVMSRFILPSSMACMKALRLSSQKVGLSFALRSAASFP